MDPFLDVIRLLRPSATLWGGVDAFGRWRLSFRKRGDLLFCWVERGDCELVRYGSAPIHLHAGDFVLVRANAPFTLGSDPFVTAVDSETAVAATGDARLRLGEGTSAPVTLRAGKFVFDTANEDLLAGFLPALVHITSRDTSSARLHSLLAMNETECRSPGPGSEFIIVRLIELILVEILRTQPVTTGEERNGLIAGLSDTVIAPALSAMHRDVAHAWTVSKLARISNVSRSTFAERFHTVIGVAPIDYLLRWRMALAKDELYSGQRNVSEIALAVGFQSSSAFSTAFTRAVGCSPSVFAATRR